MKRKSSARRASTFACIALAVCLLPFLLSAAAPEWWAEKGIYRIGSTGASESALDHAAANQGQLKNIAVGAYEHLRTTLPASLSSVGDGTANGPRARMRRLIEGWIKLDQDGSPLRDQDGRFVPQDDPELRAGIPSDYSIATIGQLKAAAEPFHARLSELLPGSGFVPPWHTPWTETPDDDQNYAAANLGQIKHVFAFDARLDTDGDGVSDIEESNLEAFNDGLQILPPIINAVTLAADEQVRVDFQFQNPLASSVSIQRKSAAYGGGWVEIGRYPVQGDQSGINLAWNDLDIWTGGVVTYRMQTHYAKRWSQYSNEASVEVTLADTDDDGLPDVWEVLAGTDPMGGDDAGGPFWDTVTFADAFEAGIRPDIPITPAPPGYGSPIAAPAVSLQEPDAEDVDLRKIKVNWSASESDSVKLFKLFEGHSDMTGWQGAEQGRTGPALRSDLLSNRTYCYRLLGIDSRTNWYNYSSVTTYEVPVVRGVLRRGQSVSYKFPGFLFYPDGAESDPSIIPSKFATATGTYWKQRELVRTFSGVVTKERRLELEGKEGLGGNVEPLEWKVQFDLTNRTATVTVDPWLEWERIWTTQGTEELTANYRADTSEGYTFAWSSAESPSGSFNAHFNFLSSIGGRKREAINGSWSHVWPTGPVYTGTSLRGSNGGPGGTWEYREWSSPFPEDSLHEGEFTTRKGRTYRGSSSLDLSSASTVTNNNPPPPEIQATTTETIDHTITLSDPVSRRDLLQAMLGSSGTIDRFGWFTPGGTLSVSEWGGTSPNSFATEPAEGKGGAAYDDANSSVSYSDTSVPEGGSFALNEEETEASFSESETKIRFYSPANPTFVIVPIGSSLLATADLPAENRVDYLTLKVDPDQTESPPIHVFGTSASLVQPTRTPEALQSMRKGSVSIATPRHVPVEVVPLYPGRRRTPGGYTYSFPSPMVESEGVSGGQVSDGPNGLMATVNLRAVITSEQCDYLPASAGGVISSARAYINGSTVPIALPLEVSKTEESSPNSMMSPLYFSGTFDGAIQIPVVEGVNTIRIAATEPTHQLEGFDTWRFRVVPEVDSAGNISYGIQDPERVDQSRGGNFDPWMLRVRGGLHANKVKDLWRIEFPGLGMGQLPLMPGRGALYGNGFLYARRLDADVPLTFTFRPNFGGAPQGGLDIFGGVPGAVDDTIEFAIGFKEGMSAGGTQMVADVESILTFGATVFAVIGAEIRIVAKAWAGYNIEEMQDEFNVLAFAQPDIEEAIDTTTELLAKLGRFSLNSLETIGEFQIALITGDWELFQQYYQNASELSEAFFDTFGEVLTAVYEAAKDMPPRQKGKLVGRVTFEIASMFVPGAAAAKVSKAEWWSRLFARNSFRGVPEFNGVAQKLGPLLSKLQTTKMCFVAGTLVWTSGGLVPIENIRANDLVWSRSEELGELRLKRVVEAFVTNPSKVVRVTYRVEPHQTRGSPTIDQLTCTRQHPFYAQNRGGFVDAGDLRSGDELILLNGSSGIVVAVTEGVEGSAIGRNTYNFEVEEFHTYFVGESGVWVHNHGRSYCEKIKSLYETFLERGSNDVWTAHNIGMQKFDSLAGLDPRLGKSGVARTQMYTEGRRRHFTDIPNSATPPPWRAAGQKLTRTSPPASNSQMAAELADNMDEFLGVGRPDGFAAHHIIPHTKDNPQGHGTMLRQLMTQKQVHPNECANGIYLPNSESVAQAYPSLGPNHRPLHTNEYLEKLWNRLSPHQSKSPNEFRDEIQRVAHEIAEGLFP